MGNLSSLAMVIYDVKKVSFLCGLCGAMSALVLSGCATSLDSQPKLPEVPQYLHVPHPDGQNFRDVEMIFMSKKAPAMASLDGCDEKFFKLREETNSNEEIQQGAIELIMQDPVQYHWCFYSKIIRLEDDLEKSESWAAKKDLAMRAYLFLVPIARAYQLEYNDSRYLRWAIQHYRRISEVVFYRRLDLTPDATMTLLESVRNPFALWRKPAEKAPVLEKYGITRSTEVAAPKDSLLDIFADTEADTADLDPDEQDLESDSSNIFDFDGEDVKPVD